MLLDFSRPVIYSKYDLCTNFLGNLENFMLFLAGAQISISHAVTLAPDTIVNWADIHTMADCQYISSNPDTVVEVNL